MYPVSQLVEKIKALFKIGKIFEHFSVDIQNFGGNIKRAVDNFADRGYATVRGVVMNRRAVENEEEKVRAFAEANGLPVVADIPRSNDIIRFEDMGKTVIEGDPSLPVSQAFLDLADLLIAEDTDED